MPKKKEVCRQGSNAGLLQRDGNPPRQSQIPSYSTRQKWYSLSGISNSGTTLEPSKKIDGFFYTAKMIVTITEKATL